MSKTAQTRVAGLIGVGFDEKDGHIRITQANDYQILMGSGETHAALQKLCSRIEISLKESGRSLSDCTPEEFMKLMEEIA